MSTTQAPTHVVFLRAINVGGRRLSMDELVAGVARLGLDAVATWQATGNLVVTTDPDHDVDELAAAVAAALRDELGLDAPAFVRTAAEVRALASATPFDAATLGGTAGKVQVLLLHATPDAVTWEQVVALVPAGEHVALDGTELWWLPAAGVSDSSFPVRRVERLVGGGTMRTQGAVAGLARRHLGAA